MILEGIVTSLDNAGELNVAPMGPIVDEAMSTILLRPFQTSRTYRNLKEHPQGVLHVTTMSCSWPGRRSGSLTRLPRRSSPRKSKVAY